MAEILAVALVVLAYGLVSGRLEGTPVTGPLIFVALGVVLGGDVLGVIDQPTLDVGWVGILAEATLVLLLFTDAIRIDLRRLRRFASIPTRMLGIALPLTVALGTLAARGVLGLSWIESFAVAAVLTPTDAALGRAVVSNPRVPIRIRQSINVESGLNDGLALPVVAVAVALLGTEAATAAGEWLSYAARQIGFGVAAGALIGWLGGRLLDRFATRGWMDGAYRQLATVAIGVAAFAASSLIGGNGFVAAFVAGIAFGAGAREHCQGAYDFAEDEGELLALLTFLVFGATVAIDALDELTLSTVLFALLALTVVRMIPVALSLVGAGLRLPTVAFLGWFGPRGLASILFGVLIVEESGSPMSDELFSVVVLVVLASIVAHGASAAPLSSRYANWYERSGNPEMESQPMPEMPTRG